MPETPGHARETGRSGNPRFLTVENNSKYFDSGRGKRSR